MKYKIKLMARTNKAIIAPYKLQAVFHGNAVLFENKGAQTAASGYVIVLATPPPGKILG